MEVIKKIVSKIDDELEDAEKYINCALKEKDKNKSLADLYYQLSLEEMKHMTLLHDQVVKIIDEHKKTNEVPPGMQVLYDYIHEKEIKWASKIKGKQDMYK